MFAQGLLFSYSSSWCGSRAIIQSFNQSINQSINQVELHAASLFPLSPLSFSLSLSAPSPSPQTKQANQPGNNEIINHTKKPQKKKKKKKKNQEKKTLLPTQPVPTPANPCSRYHFLKVIKIP
jgi:hypothetical protein